MINSTSFIKNSSKFKNLYIASLIDRFVKSDYSVRPFGIFSFKGFRSVFRADNVEVIRTSNLFTEDQLWKEQSWFV